MPLRKIMGPLRNPKFVSWLLFGSVCIAALLTVSNPAPLRRSLGLASSGQEKVPSALVAGSTNQISPDKIAVNASGQLLAIAPEARRK